MPRARLVELARELRQRVARLAERSNASSPRGDGIGPIAPEDEIAGPRESLRCLEESHDRLAALYEEMPVAYMTMDASGRITSANPSACAMLGADRWLLNGRRLAAYASYQDRAALSAAIGRCVSARARQEISVTFSSPGRSTVQIICVPSFGPARQVDGCRVTMTDVTALKTAQDKLTFLTQAGVRLAASFDYKAALADVASLAVPLLGDICLIDVVADSGAIERVGAAFSSASLRHSLAPLVHRRRPAHEQGALERVIATAKPLILSDISSSGGSSQRFEVDLLLSMSGARSALKVPIVSRGIGIGVITLACVRPGAPHERDVLVTACDLAARAAMAIDNARLYEKEQRAAAARETMLAFVSHDLRNPLMAIELTAESLLACHPASGERRRGWRQLARLRQSVDQMRRMIGDLLDATGLEAGHLTVVPERLDLKRLLDEGAALLAPLAAAKGVALRFQGGDQGLQVRGDRDRLLQVLSNLVGNAIKFTPAGGTVTVGVRRGGAEVIFSVSDTGPGIAPALRSHVFERYWQANETARKGRGLGLFIAKGLIEAHGGSIWIEDQAPPGCTFSFTLPLARIVKVDSFQADHGKAAAPA